MLRRTLVLVLTFALSAGGAAIAGDRDGPPPGPPQGGPPGPPPGPPGGPPGPGGAHKPPGPPREHPKGCDCDGCEMRRRIEELKKRADKDGDGQVSEEEKEAVKREILERRRQRKEAEAGENGERKGEDGCGRRERWERRRAEILKHFDQDGDGKLNAEERGAAERALREHKEELKRRLKDDPRAHEKKVADLRRHHHRKRHHQCGCGPHQGGGRPEGGAPHEGGGRPEGGDQHGGPKGNNGVGNGEDPAPPGNPRPNDGPGAGPGNPGNKGGHGAR